MKKFILLLISLPIAAFAEPSALTRQLMQEPASLFDVGMLRLEYSMGYREKQIIANYNRASSLQAESQPNRRKSSGNVNVAFDPAADKIYIHLSIGDALSTQAQMRAGCKSALRDIMIVVTKAGPSFFEHEKAEESSTAPERYFAILDFFEMRCYVRGQSSSDVRFRATQTYGSEMKIGELPMPK